ncbi:MAG: YfcC family protein [Candidatus Nanopelagicales bacterium]
MSDTETAPAPEAAQPAPPAKKKFKFPGAMTTLAIVTVLVWVAALLLPPGKYQVDADGLLVPGTYHRVPAPLTFLEQFQQLIRSPINGLYGIQNSETGFVDTETVGRMFGAIGVVAFIMSIGAFIAVSFETRALEVAISSLASKLKDRGWLLIAAIMVVFSLLGSTMGFSVETFGFYSLFIPLMAALGYDRLTTAAMIIVGALIGVMGATVNPFSIGVASGEAGVSIGDGILLRVFLWAVLTAMAVFWVVRYGQSVRQDPSKSLVGFDEEISDDEAAADPLPDTMTGTQKIVLGITIFAFGLMIFAVIPWSSLLGGTVGPAEDYLTHEVSSEPVWFELGWWFPQLAMLFILASIAVGVVAKMGEAKTSRLIAVGASDMMSPAIVVLLASGVSVIMNNTQTLATILNMMENAISGASASVFALMTILVNIPLAFLIPSSSGHAMLAMPLLGPLADFANVGRPLMITAFMMGHGLAIISAPTSVVVVGGLAMAKVGYDKYLKMMWPLLAAMFVVSAVVVMVAATVL